jgi:hypothetical protein
MEENRVIAETFYQRFLAEVQTPENYNEDDKEIIKYGFQRIDEGADMEITKQPYKMMWLGFCAGLSVGLELASSNES